MDEVYARSSHEVDETKFPENEFDCDVIEAVAEQVEELIRRNAANPSYVFGLARLLYGLQQYPQAIPNLQVELSLSREIESEGFVIHTIWAVNHYGDYIDVCLLEYYYDKRIGGDTETRVQYYLETGWEESNLKGSMNHWLRSLRQNMDSISIEITDDSEIEIPPCESSGDT